MLPFAALVGAQILGTTTIDTTLEISPTYTTITAPRPTSTKRVTKTHTHLSTIQSTETTIWGTLHAHSHNHTHHPHNHTSTETVMTIVSALT